MSRPDLFPPLCKPLCVPGSRVRVQDRDGCTAAAAPWVCLGQVEDEACSGQSPSRHPGQKNTHTHMHTYVHTHTHTHTHTQWLMINMLQCENLFPAAFIESSLYWYINIFTSAHITTLQLFYCWNFQSGIVSCKMGIRTDEGRLRSKRLKREAS